MTGERFRQRVEEQLSKAVVGQKETIEMMLIVLLSEAHALLVGVPGLAKTLLIKSLARTLHLDFSRIQFTPDLMPSDVLGTEVLDTDPATGAKSFRFMPGPVFTNVLLADEINRTPPKTQSALLEAMQELRVTVGGETRPLERPFLVLATQNPIEQEGTYPLPEAQQDRFMMEIRIGYPSEEEERRIAELVTGGGLGEPEPVVTSEELLAACGGVRKLPAPDHVVDYAVSLARSTRPVDGADDFIRQNVFYGAGPRASLYLLLGAKARAYLHGRPVPSSADIRALAQPVLRHRLVLSFNAEAEGVTVEQVVEHALGAVPVGE